MSEKNFSGSKNGVEKVNWPQEKDLRAEVSSDRDAQNCGLAALLNHENVSRWETIYN